METLGIWHWFIVLFFLAIYIVPVWKILTKAGDSGAWSLLGFVPLLNVVMLWLFAFSTWPRDRK